MQYKKCQHFFYKTIIKRIEKVVKQQAKLRKEYEMLLTITGIGIILAMTIMFEVGDIGRFKNVGDYSSYSRCVGGNRSSPDRNVLHHRNGGVYKKGGQEQT
jgi:transposase